MHVDIFFATISGRAAKGAAAVQQALLPLHSRIFDLKTTSTQSFQESRLQVWISPTYGKGDCHYLWRGIGTQIRLADGVTVFPLALGDARHHGATFGGAFEQLVELAKNANAQVVIDQCWDQQRAVLDYVSDRNGFELKIQQFANGIRRFSNQSRKRQRPVMRQVPLTVGDEGPVADASSSDFYEKTGR